jgi:hypothetical protein
VTAIASAPARYAAVCRRCEAKLLETSDRKEVFSAAFRHKEHGNEDVFIVDLEAKVGKADIMIRTGQTASVRKRGEPAGKHLSSILNEARETRNETLETSAGGSE